MPPRSYLEVINEKKKRKVRLKLIGIFGLVLFFLLAVVFLIIKSPIFKIKNFQIQADQAAMPTGTLNYFQSVALKKSSPWGYYLGADNFFAWPNYLSAGDLSLMPEISQASIQKDFWGHTLIISPVSRQPFGIWCVHNPETSCFWFDNTGVAFQKALQSQGNVIVSVDEISSSTLSLGETVLPSQFLGNFFSVIQVLNEAQINPTKISVNLNLEEADIEVAGLQIYFSLRFSAQNDLAGLEQLQSSPGLNNLQYIDFRSENKVFYK